MVRDEGDEGAHKGNQRGRQEIKNLHEVQVSMSLYIDIATSYFYKNPVALLCTGGRYGNSSDRYW
jgi:hypothetical protein